MKLKQLKILGLTISAAAALTAFVGASSASATVLCTTNATSNCGGGWIEPVGTEYAAKSEGWSIWETTGGSIENECESTIRGKITNSGSSTSTVFATIEGLTWENCSFTTKTITPGFLEIHHIAGTDNGTMTMSSTEVTTVLFGISCIYKIGTGWDIGTFTEGKPATMDYAPIWTSTSFGCPSSIRWTISYLFEKPTGTLGVAAS